MRSNAWNNEYHYIYVRQKRYAYLYSRFKKTIFLRIRKFQTCARMSHKYSLYRRADETRYFYYKNIVTRSRRHTHSAADVNQNNPLSPWLLPSVYTTQLRTLLRTWFCRDQNKPCQRHKKDQQEREREHEYTSLRTTTLAPSLSAIKFRYIHTHTRTLDYVATRARVSWARAGDATSPCHRAADGRGLYEARPRALYGNREQSSSK